MPTYWIIRYRLKPRREGLDQKKAKQSEWLELVCTSQKQADRYADFFRKDRDRYDSIEIIAKNT